MIQSKKGWQKLFLFCLGLFLGTAFCMKWMEGDFVSNGRLFTIIGLEISYPKEKVVSVLAGLDDKVRTILRYHLWFDFAFMAGVYPGIAALCMMTVGKVTKNGIKKILVVLAFMQLVAWGCDIYENILLLRWVSYPVIGNEFGFYHFIVALKWVFALAGVLTAVVFFFSGKRSPQ